MRTFEFKDDKAYKFWRIELSGKSFTVKFGRNGTAGQLGMRGIGRKAPTGRNSYSAPLGLGLGGRHDPRALPALPWAEIFRRVAAEIPLRVHLQK